MESTDITFERWVDHCFDHEVREEQKQEWYWDKDAPYIQLPIEIAGPFFIRLFSEASTALADFTDAQVNQGLWYLVCAPCSSNIFDVFGFPASYEQRRKAIESIYLLFAHYFAEKCSPELSAYRNVENPLNSVCYMFWDLLNESFIGGKDEEGVASNKEAMQVMGKILTIENIACQESALHGLGHWEYYYPEDVAVIIKKFLQENPLIPDELKEYAQSAMEGMVL